MSDITVGATVSLVRAHSGIPSHRDIEDLEARLNAAVELPVGTTGVVRQESSPGGDAGYGWWVVDFTCDGVAYADVVHESHLVLAAG